MAKKLFVGGLDWAATEAELNELFSQYGTVEEAIIIVDRERNRSKGFGFVTFTNDEEADAAISALDGSEWKDRKIIVNEARPKEPRY